MTDEQIIEALATKVMGWPLVDMPYSGDAENYVYRRGSGLGWIQIDGGLLIYKGFNPLRSSADSKMVRDKLTDQANQVTLKMYNVNGKLSYSCERWELGMAATSVDADTEFRAVALCALKTVGIEIKQ